MSHVTVNNEQASTSRVAQAIRTASAWLIDKDAGGESRYTMVPASGVACAPDIGDRRFTRSELAAHDTRLPALLDLIHANGATTGPVSFSASLVRHNLDFWAGSTVLLPKEAFKEKKKIRRAQHVPNYMLALGFSLPPACTLHLRFMTLHLATTPSIGQYVTDAKFSMRELDADWMRSKYPVLRTLENIMMVIGDLDQEAAAQHVLFGRPMLPTTSTLPVPETVVFDL